MDCVSSELDPVESIFRRAYENNDLEKVKYIVGLGYDIDKSRAFLVSCLNGYFEMAKWIYFNMNVEEVSHYYAFIYACKSGHLEMAQWIDEIFTDTRYTRAEYATDAFVVACNNDHLHVTKWLQTIGADITTPDILIMPCIMGSIEFVEWLHSQNVDISNQAAFIHACKRHHIDIIEFLIDKYYKFNGYIKFDGVIDFDERINKLLIDSNVVHPKHLGQRDLKYYLEINNNCVPDDYICPFPEFTTKIRGKHTKSAR